MMMMASIVVDEMIHHKPEKEIPTWMVNPPKIMLMNIVCSLCEVRILLFL
jgi:hypothetical protein